MSGEDASVVAAPDAENGGGVSCRAGEGGGVLGPQSLVLGQGTGSGGGGGGVEGTLTAVQIGRELGREKRQVLQWFTDGCPHVLAHHGKRPEKRAKLSDVKAYIAKLGLHEKRYKAVKEDKIHRTPTAAEGAEGEGKREVLSPGSLVLGPEERKGSGGGGGGGGGGGEKTVFDLAVDAKIAEMLDAGGDVNFAVLYGQAKGMLGTVFKSPPKGEDIAEMDRWAGALDKATRAVRMLDESRQKERERAGTMIERGEAVKMLVSLSQAYVGSTEALRLEMVRRLMAALEAHLVAGAAEAVRRVIVVAVREATDVIREQLAGAMRRSPAAGKEVAA